jgi:hypothetical protein
VWGEVYEVRKAQSAREEQAGVGKRACTLVGRGSAAGKCVCKAVCAKRRKGRVRGGSDAAEAACHAEG